MELAWTGLKPSEMAISESAVRDIIRYYTREGGVRALERELSKICRKVVKQLLLKPRKGTVKVDASNLNKLLGVRKFRYGEAEAHIRRALTLSETTGDNPAQIAELLGVLAQVERSRVTPRMGQCGQRVHRVEGDLRHVAAKPGALFRLGPPCLVQLQRRDRPGALDGRDRGGARPGRVCRPHQDGAADLRQARYRAEHVLQRRWSRCLESVQQVADAYLGTSGPSKASLASCRRSKASLGSHRESEIRLKTR